MPTEREHHPEVGEAEIAIQNILARLELQTGRKVDDVDVGYIDGILTVQIDIEGDDDAD